MLEQSARVTDAYRQRLLRLQQLAALLGQWTVTTQDIDRSGQAWLARAVPQLQVMQGAGVALTAGYVSAFKASETSTPPTAAHINSAGVGNAADGQPLLKSLAAALITVKVAIKDGRSPEQALKLGEQRATRLAASASLAAPRVALHSAIAADPAFIGWRRVTFGGCGACLAAADGIVHSPDKPLAVHDHCRCTAEPVLDGAPDDFTRPTGRDMFDAMSFEQQAELLGERKAALIRSGSVAFDRLIQPQPMAVMAAGITEAPLQALV